MLYTSEGNRYLHLPGLIVTESASGETRYLLSDGLGSVRHVVDEYAEIVSYQEFDPYGSPVTGGEAGYGFTGEWWESDVELLNLRARWYDPGMGVFLSRDAVESEPPYQYVRGNTINLVDPSGKTPWPRSEIGKKFMYSCKCGWIDWGHAAPQKPFIKDIFESIDHIVASNTTSGFVFGLRQMPSRFRLDTTNITTYEDKEAVALGIYISSHNIWERYIQGTSWDPRAWQSQFSGEDLVSNLIGFYRGVDLYPAYPDVKIPDSEKLESQKTYMEICGVVAHKLYSTNPSEFERIQQSIWDDIGHYPILGGLHQHEIWGTRPKIRWDGSVYGVGTVSCKNYNCPQGSQDSHFLPPELLRIVPRPPKNGWEWLNYYPMDLPGENDPGYLNGLLLKWRTNAGIGPIQP